MVTWLIEARLRPARALRLCGACPRLVRQPAGVVGGRGARAAHQSVPVAERVRVICSAAEDVADAWGARAGGRRGAAAAAVARCVARRVRRRQRPGGRRRAPHRVRIPRRVRHCTSMPSCALPSRRATPRRLLPLACAKGVVGLLQPRTVALALRCLKAATRMHSRPVCPP